MQSEKVNRGEQREMVLHFVNGRLQLDESTSVSSKFLTCFATVYSDENMGMAESSNVTIGYNEDQQVWVTVQNDEGRFEWGSWETERKVAVLFYVLAYEGEYLLFCSNKNFFCYSAIPQKDPRQNRDGRIPNAHMNATYHVLDELLRQTNQHTLKVLPVWFEG